MDVLLRFDERVQLLWTLDLDVNNKLGRMMNRKEFVLVRVKRGGHRCEFDRHGRRNQELKNKLQDGQDQVCAFFSNH